jgi:hypothetical protein
MGSAGVVRIYEREVPRGQRGARERPNGLAVSDDFPENRLPDDLQPLADALRAEREVADGHLLERVLRRAKGGAPSRRRSRLLSPRTAVILTLALAVVVGARLSHFNVTHEVATLADTITNSTSNTSSGLTTSFNYCNEGTKLGTGWAPTFRWHYGAPGTYYPSPYDDGWSASIQPDCTTGKLTIPLIDHVTAQPNIPFDLGYDFHTANKPNFIMKTTNPTAVINYECSSAGPVKTVTILISSGNSYNSVVNTWVPTGTDNDPAGFQKTGTLGPLCGTGKPIYVLGGTFTSQVDIIWQ